MKSSATSDIIFCVNMPSQPSSPLMAYVSEHWDGQTYCICDTLMREERKKMGWPLPDVKKTILHPLDNEKNRKTLLNNLWKNIKMLSTFWAVFVVAKL
jgi:hypothetical protein